MRNDEFKIILDKNVFISEDIMHLDNLSRRQTVILPSTLLQECATSDELKTQKLMCRIYDLILNGAWMALEEPNLFDKEIKELKPCNDIIDYNLTYDIRKNGMPNESNLSQYDIKQMIWGNIDWQRTHIFKMVDVGKEKCPEAIQELNRENLTKMERWIKLFESIDKIVDYHEIAINIKETKNDITDPNKFCTSPEWMSWQYLRLLQARTYYDQLTIHRGGQLPGDENFERSRMDMEYVWLLAKADVLLTNDDDMKAMAEAAFPEKRVYTSIEEFS